jgi:uncharacterized protein (TIGR00369 family)
LQTHFEKLIRIYEAAPINLWFQPKLLIPKAGESEIQATVRPDFFHAGKATHGAIYFKMLDDAAYFTVQSLVTDFFIVTTSFNVHFLRPITKGQLIARGKLIQNAKRLFVAEATLENENGKAIGQGSGTFVRSTTTLESLG